jgi:hemerythrin
VLVEFDQRLDAWREEGDGVRLLAWLSRDVPAWFVTHVGTMDSVSAQWLASHGG